MNLSIEKFFGWILLIIGVIIISWTLVSSYNIFTGKSEAPKIFSAEVSIETPKKAVQGQKIETMEQIQVEFQAQIEEMIGQQIKNLLPSETMFGFLNLIVWSIFSGILFFGGSQVSSLGIKLLKNNQ